MARKQDAPSPRPVTDADVDPRHRWDRPLQAPGHTQVDFEERVDFRRLHAYRLGRARQALARSGLGAILVVDQYNSRYLSGTVIGEWARDKLTRWSLLTGTGEPWVWDFGSAARHHRLYAPWIPDRAKIGSRAFLHRRAVALAAGSVGGRRAPGVTDGRWAHGALPPRANADSRRSHSAADRVGRTRIC